MKFFEGKINKLIFLSSIFLGFISPVNSEDFQSKFVQKITIPKDSKQTREIVKKIYKKKGPAFMSLKSDVKIGKHW